MRVLCGLALSLTDFVYLEPAHGRNCHTLVLIWNYIFLYCLDMRAALLIVCTHIRRDYKSITVSFLLSDSVSVLEFYSMLASLGICK